MELFFTILFLIFELLYFKYQLQKPFNISLVEVQKHVVSKNSICDNNFFMIVMWFHPT
jgi:hypothetical protein